MMPLKQRQTIMNAGGGTARLATPFEAIQKKPISRVIVQAIAHQDDYMKHVRRNGAARDVLAPKGIAILWGTGDKGLIERLKLGPVGPNEFVSYKTDRSGGDCAFARCTAYRLNGQDHSRTAFRQHGAYPLGRHKAGNDRAPHGAPPRISLSPSSARPAGQTRSCLCFSKEDRLFARLLLARPRMQGWRNRREEQSGLLGTQDRAQQRAR
jgi:Restriction endonuclease NaeI